MENKPVVPLELNAPLEGCLKFPTGKHFDSKYPGKEGRSLYGLVSGEAIYIDRNFCQDPDRMFRERGIGQGTPFTICLRKTKSGEKYYEVQRLGDSAEPARKSFDELPTDLERKLTASIDKANQEKAQRALSSQDSPAAPLSARNTGAPVPQQPHVTPAAQGQTRASSVMGAALIAAIDAVRLAEDYARSKGIPVEPLKVEFLAEDLRCIAATAYIQACKDPLFSERMNAGGASQWRQ